MNINRFVVFFSAHIEILRFRKINLCYRFYLFKDKIHPNLIC